jgi:hypothetical protein
MHDLWIPITLILRYEGRPSAQDDHRRLGWELEEDSEKLIEEVLIEAIAVGLMTRCQLAVPAIVDTRDKRSVRLVVDIELEHDDIYVRGDMMFLLVGSNISMDVSRALLQKITNATKSVVAEHKRNSVAHQRYYPLFSAAIRSGSYLESIPPIAPFMISCSWPSACPWSGQLMSCDAPWS